MSNTADVVFQTTGELIDFGKTTFSELSIIVDAWDYEGWDMYTELHGDEIRVYAERVDDDCNDRTPSPHEHWNMVSYNLGYTVVAKKLS